MPLAIITQYRGPVGARGAHYSARYTGNGKRVSIPIDHSTNSHGNHEAALKALLVRLDLTPGTHRNWAHASLDHTGGRKVWVPIDVGNTLHP